MPELLLRPDLPRQAYTLHCQVVLPAKPDAPAGSHAAERWLDHAMREKLRQGNLFIQHMERQGWRYLGEGLDFTGGPYVYEAPRGIPKRPTMPRRQKGRPSEPLNDTTDWGYYLRDVPELGEAEQWAYRLSGRFARTAIRREILVEDIPLAS